MNKIKRYLKKKSGKISLIVVINLIIVAILFFPLKNLIEDLKEEKVERYLASTETDVLVYDLDFKEKMTLPRGTKVSAYKKVVTKKNEKGNYYQIIYENKKYLIKDANLETDIKKVVKETTLYVRTSTTIYENDTSSKIKGLSKKGSELEIIGFNNVDENGKVDRYQIKDGEVEGYVYGKYLVNTKELALANYEPEAYFTVHEKRKAGDLDYYPVDKPKFTDNVMPDEVRALYLNCGGNVIGNIDAYIEVAKAAGINAFVVDIKDNTAPAYKSKVMEEYSPTNYKKAFNSFEKYQNAIKKLKDAGFYVIGRITVFKDTYYAADHPEYNILSLETGEDFVHNSSKWPSAYQREVWEFNVELAKEAVREMGFNEIQFDYIRFPDRTTDSTLDFRNLYEESKAQAIQRFLMYAVDEIHKEGAYVAADVFGESAHLYVSRYGQYWPAISNVADVISGMPYPDHFSKYEYGFKEVVWTVPYKLLNFWANTYVVKRQAEIPTPAIVRNWIQTYNTAKTPAVVYDAGKISDQIQALYDAGLKTGFMTWNAGSSLSKYKEISEALKKEY